MADKTDGLPVMKYIFRLILMQKIIHEWPQEKELAGKSYLEKFGIKKGSF